MRRIVLGIITGICLSLPATAQEELPESIFRDYGHMREVLDQLMMESRIVEVMRAFGASDEMTTEELESLQARVRSIFPNDFTEVDLMKRDEMGEGWGRELYAFWSGFSYIYASVIYHQRETEFVAVHFTFNTDLDSLLADF